MLMDIRYIAGLFDGEGSVGIYRNRNKDHIGFSLRTQVTQNKNSGSTEIMSYLKERFGGNVSEQKTLSGDTKYNWQLNAGKAAKFLKEMLPHLILKRDQADIAIAWQDQRPTRVRDERGRISLSHPHNKELNEQVSNFIKRLKKEDIDVVMEDAKDLVEIKHTLRQIVNVKGD